MLFYNHSLEIHRGCCEYCPDYHSNCIIWYLSCSSPLQQPEDMIQSQPAFFERSNTGAPLPPISAKTLWWHWWPPPTIIGTLHKCERSWASLLEQSTGKIEQGKALCVGTGYVVAVGVHAGVLRHMQPCGHLGLSEKMQMMQVMTLWIIVLLSLQTNSILNSWKCSKQGVGRSGTYNYVIWCNFIWLALETSGLSHLWRALMMSLLHSHIQLLITHWSKPDFATHQHSHSVNLLFTIWHARPSCHPILKQVQSHQAWDPSGRITFTKKEVDMYTPGVSMFLVSVPGMLHYTTFGNITVAARFTWSLKFVDTHTNPDTHTLCDTLVPNTTVSISNCWLTTRRSQRPIYQKWPYLIQVCWHIWPVLSP